MSLYVLDTDTITLYQWDHPAVCQNNANHQADQIRITIISVEEQLTGWYSFVRRAKTLDQVADAYERLTENVMFWSGFEILLFSAQAIRRYESLKNMKLRVGANDLRIAAITLENGATLVTRNLRDFQRIPGLMIEDWSA